jgi:nickel/cobalt transporter (NicO) family protein
LFWYYQLYARVVHLQGELQALVADQVRRIAETGTVAPSVAAVAIALGTLHAMTPGHGKSVVVSYFIGRDAQPFQGFAMAARVAFSHTITAVLLVLFFGGAVTLLGRPTGAASVVQSCSYALIAMMGGYYLFRSLRPSNRLHDHATVLPYAIGVLPCPLTMLVVGHAMMLGAFVTGLALAGLMGLGAAVTIGVFGLLGMLLRRGLLGMLDPQGKALGTVLTVLEIGSAVAILLLGLGLFAGNL